MEGVAKRVGAEHVFRDDQRQHVEENEKRTERDAAWAGEERFTQAQQAGAEAEKDGREHERRADETADVETLVVQIQVFVFKDELRFALRVFFALTDETCVDWHHGIVFPGPWRRRVRLAVVGRNLRGGLDDDGGREAAFRIDGAAGRRVDKIRRRRRFHDFRRKVRRGRAEEGLQQETQAARRPQDRKAREHGHAVRMACGVRVVPHLAHWLFGCIHI